MVKKAARNWERRRPACNERFSAKKKAAIAFKVAQLTQRSI
jgi:hypothetical protein